MVISEAAPTVESDQTLEQTTSKDVMFLSRRSVNLFFYTTASTIETVMSPANLQVFNVDATTILLSWDASPTPDVTGYRIALQNAFNEEEPPIDVRTLNLSIFLTCCSWCLYYCSFKFKMSKLYLRDSCQIQLILLNFMHKKTVC